jgi:acetolactate synthase I/II/III large subunit
LRYPARERNDAENHDMNGAEALLRTLLDAGVEVCFTNPGTSEMHFVAALDRVPGMRCVLGLFEGVVTGAADGYARIAGKPAATLLHLGPGLGNGLANLHNARRADVAIVNIVGDHATYHLQYDTPLTSDVVAVAEPMSHWVQSSQSSEHLPDDAVHAVAAARTAPGQIATLILPADVSWEECAAGPAAPADLPAPRHVREDTVAHCAQALASGEPAMVLLGGHVGDRELELAGRIGAATGARVAVETFPTRMPWGAGHATCEKIPYLAEFAIEHLKTVRRMILVGAREPASFFAYPNLPSLLKHEECEVLVLAEPHHDRIDALERLAGAVHAQAAEPPRNPLAPPALPGAVALSTGAVGDIIAALLPEGAIVVDEGATCGMEVFARTRTARAHEWLVLTGGAIGWGLPAATGAAIAAPGRKVVCLEGDGSAMYTIQALWTMAREQLDVTVVLFANRDYAILQLEYMRVGATGMGDKARAMMHIGNPDIDFVALAQSMGVHATRAADAAEFAAQFADAMATHGPRLIETMMPSFGL